MRRFLPLLAVACLAAGAWAAEPVQYNMVSLTADARREVPNDQANAVLYVEFNDKNPAALADQLNQAVAAGLQVAKGYPEVRSWVGTNNTYPVYGTDGKAQGWRGHAEVRLESPNTVKLAELVGQLQANMQLGSINFSLAPTSRDRLNTALIDDAIAAFRARADVVRKSLGGSHYKLVSMNVNTQSGGVVPRMFAMHTESKLGSAVTPPPMEPGVSQLTVEVSGTIQVD